MAARRRGRDRQAPGRAATAPASASGMVKIKRVRTIDAVVMGWRPGKEEGTLGSLILGLYDDDGQAARGRPLLRLRRQGEARAARRGSRRTRRASAARATRAAGTTSASSSGSRCGPSSSSRSRSTTSPTTASGTARRSSAGATTSRPRPARRTSCCTDETKCVSLRTMPVHRIARFGFVNAYLVEEDDGLTLVDTDAPALREEDPRRRRAARRADRRGSPSRTRTATTSARSTRSPPALPDAEVLISARDARLLAKDMTLDPGERAGQAARRLPAAPRRAPTRTFAAGDRIGSLEVHRRARSHARPGRFLDTRDRTLYCADAYSTLGGVATTAKPYPRFPLPASRPGTARPRSRPPGRCARSTPRGSPRATARSSRRPAPRWTRAIARGA